MVQLQNITKTFDGVSILENASYTFPARGLVCLMGPSGCGKTTLLNLIAGFDSDYRGTIRSCGQELEKLDRDGLSAYRRDCVGFVFQNYHLLPGLTVLENILLPAELTAEPPQVSRERAEALLARLGLSGKADQRVETLSGGQKQRVAIARALMGEPPLLLADEPTGALDRATSNEIMALLQELARDRLVLVITHDEKVCAFADRVLRIRDRTLAPQPEAPEQLPAAPAPSAGAGRPAPGKRALRNFRGHLGRYGAVAAAIALGFLAFLFSLSFGNVMDREIAAFQEKNTVFNNGYVKGADDGTLLRLLEEDPRVEAVYDQYILRDVTLSAGGQSQVLAEKYPMPKTTEALSYGVMPRRGAGEIALTPSLAKKYAPDIQSLLGQSIRLSVGGADFDLTVSGIYNAGYDDFFVSPDVEQALYGGLPAGDRYSLSYDVAAFGDVVPVSELLAARGFRAETAAAEVAAMEATFRTLGQLFFTISVLVVVLALFLCVLLLVKLQNSRYRELGLLAALGFRAGYIRRMIRGENLLLAAFSSLVTAVLLLAAGAVCRAVGFPLQVGGLEFLAGAAGAFAVVLSVSSLASARLIRTQPADALKRR